MRARKAFIAVATSGAFLATTVLLSTPAAYAATTTHTASTSSTSGGYIAIGSSGQVSTGGGATSYGSATSSSKIVGGAPTVDGGGYYLVAADGSVYTFGDAKFYGSTFSVGITGFGGKHPLNAPIVGMAVVPGGYYLVAADGGVFNFGAAKFLGSTYSYGITGLSGSHPLNAPIVGIVPTPSGSGYWLVAKDGGIFDFGAAPFLGSTYTYGITGLSGKHPLNAPIVGAIASPSGQGYYMVAADGGVFNFGDAKFTGSTYNLGYTGLSGKNPLPAKVSSLMANPSGTGYYAICADGKILAIGGAAPLPAIKHIRGPIVAVIPPKAVGLAHKTQTHQPQTPQLTKQPQTPQQPQQPYIPPAPTTPTITTSLASLYPAGSVQLNASGGDGSYTWSATNLPTGLSLSSSGVLSVDSSTVNSSTFSSTGPLNVTVTSAGLSASQEVALEFILPAAFTTSTFDASSTGTLSDQLALPAADGTGYTFAESTAGTAWPSTLSVSSTGVITGSLSASVSGIDVEVLYDGDSVGTLPISFTVSSAPSPTVSLVESQNWAGMIANTTSNTNAISEVTGTYVVPTMSSTQSTLCQNNEANYGCMVANWVGIDGQSDLQLIQAGTFSYPTHPTQAWVEFITPNNAAPSTYVTLTTASGTPISINPGDHITVSIIKNSSQNWTMTIDDTTQNASYSITQNFEASIHGTLFNSNVTGESAEWIAESPEYSVYSGSPLADLCAVNPVGSGTTAPCNAFSIIPQISAGGQFLSQTMTSTGLSSAYSEFQSSTAMNGYNLAANGDGLLTPSGYATKFALTGFGFTQNGA